MEIKKTSWPNIYTCNFIEQGLVRYENDGVEEILYVPKETLDRMLPSMIGKPVVVKHRKVNPDNYEQYREERIIVGNVIRAWFNPADGWFWCDFIVDIQAGRDRIDQHQDSVSCAYSVLDAKEGGVWHDIKYDGEVIDGEYTHLALVDSPRYEGAKITKQIPAMLVNEKSAHLFNNKEEYMNLKDLLFKKKADGTKEKLEGIVVINGKDVDLGEFLGTLIEKINDKAPKEVGLQDVIKVNGKDVTIKSLVEMAIKNEKKNCNCNAKDGDMHKEDCPMWTKENAGGKDEDAEAKAKEEEIKEKENARIKAKALANGKTEEEIRKEEAEEKTNSKVAVDARIKELELENARLKKDKEGTEFFNSLEQLANSVNADKPTDAPLPTTRQERANRKSEQVKKQFASSAK